MGKINIGSGALRRGSAKEAAMSSMAVKGGAKPHIYGAGLNQSRLMHNIHIDCTYVNTAKFN